VGDATLHLELWIPSEDMALFNQHLIGQIRVIERFYGEKFAGKIDPVTKLPHLFD